MKQSKGILKRFYGFTKAKGRPFMCGALIGAVLAAASPVLAESIQVTLDTTIRLIIDGNEKTLPEDYHILNYQGRTYLPTRYVAEELGARVTWDGGFKTITIDSPEPEIVEKIVEVPKEVEKIVYVEKDATEYKQLPTVTTVDGVTVTLRTYNNQASGSLLSGFSRLTCEIENNNAMDNIIVDYGNAVMVADGVELKTILTPTNLWDSKLVNGDINPGKNVSGFIVFPLVDSKAKEFTLKLPIRNQGTREITNYEIMFTTTISNN